MSILIEQIASYLGISKEVTASIFVSIVVFLTGIVINSIIHIIRKYKERSIHRKISKTNHQLLINKIRTEAKNMKFFSDQLTIDHPGSYHYKWSSIPSISIFKEIGYANFYKAYFTGFENLFSFWRRSKIDAFNALWLSIEFLSLHHLDSKLRGEKYIELNGKFNELRNMEAAKAQKLIEEYRIRFNGQLGRSEPMGIFFGKRENIIKKYADTPNKELPRNTDKYLTRILQLNRDNVKLLTRYNSDIKPAELNSYILESNYRYENQKNHLESAKFYFENLYAEYIKSYESLISSFRILNFGTLSFSSRKIRPYIVIQVKVIFKKFSLN